MTCKSQSDILSSIIGQIKVAGLIGDFCLLIESFCKQKLEKTGTLGSVYYNSIKDLYGWSNHPADGQLKLDFEQDSLENTLDTIFEGHYISDDKIQNSFLLTWGLRNKVHHNIFSTTVIQKHWKEIILNQMRFFLDFAINKPIP